MARPRYVLTQPYYHQQENQLSKSSSGMSLAGRLYQVGEEIEWDDKPTWFMQSANAEAAAMLLKYPPIDPLNIDDMIDRSINDAKDNNLKERSALNSSRDMQATPENAEGHIKRRGRPPKHVEV